MDAISTAERACSTFSILGSLFVIVTYSTVRSFHKPVNRLIFYASFGNLMSNVASIMGRSFLSNINSAGCQFQAFAIQMFLPADAFFILAMAINVYLTFYHRYTADRLRRLDPYYIAACYGVPFIPALAFIFVDSPQQGRGYGDANIWCWISDSYDLFRMVIFYIPVWIVLAVSLGIYIRAGGDIISTRRQLRYISHHTSDNDTFPTQIDNEPPSKPEIKVVTTTTMQSAGKEPGGTPNAAAGMSRGPQGFEDPGAAEAQVEGGVERHPSMKSSTRLSDSSSVSSGHEGAKSGHGRTYSIKITSDTPVDRPTTSGTAAGVASTQPSSTLAPTTGQQDHVYRSSGVGGAGPQPNAGARNANNTRATDQAIWAYAKTSMLLFCAILVTWIPSTANRVYSIITHDTSDVLEVMSCAVLSLQGFWNAVIYCVTSWSAVCKLWAKMQVSMGCAGRDNRHGEAHEMRGRVSKQKHRAPAGRAPGTSGGNAPSSSSSTGDSFKKWYGSESVTELTQPRSSAGGGRDQEGGRSSWET